MLPSIHANACCWSAAAHVRRDVPHPRGWHLHHHQVRLGEDAIGVRNATRQERHAARAQLEPLVTGPDDRAAARQHDHLVHPGVHVQGRGRSCRHRRPGQRDRAAGLRAVHEQLCRSLTEPPQRLATCRSRRVRGRHPCFLPVCVPDRGRHAGSSLRGRIFLHGRKNSDLVFPTVARCVPRRHRPPGRRSSPARSRPARQAVSTPAAVSRSPRRRRSARCSRPRRTSRRPTPCTGSG